MKTENTIRECQHERLLPLMPNKERTGYLTYYCMDCYRLLKSKDILRTSFSVQIPIDKL